MPEKKYIRFIDSDYNTLFQIEDGANIIMTRYDGLKKTLKCRFLDEYHTEIGGECFHICQWAEIMERNGNTYRQETYISDPEFYPRRYLTPTSDEHRPPYYGLDEARGFAVAYAPQGAPGKKYCVFDRIPGERRSEYRIGDYRVFCGRPQIKGTARAGAVEKKAGGAKCKTHQIPPTVLIRWPPCRQSALPAW